MHHRILPIPCKPYTLNWLPERLIVSHYENNYGAAVRSLNAVRDRLAGMDPTASIAAEIRALKREELSAMASVVLHELYFANLSGGGKVPGEKMAAALVSRYGSLEAILRAAEADAAAGPLAKVRRERDYLERAQRVVRIPTNLLGLLSEIPHNPIDNTTPEPFADRDGRDPRRRR